MSNPLKYPVTLFFLSVSLFTSSQIPKIDSLYRVLAIEKEDTPKVNTLNAISDFYLYYLPPKAEKYATEALELSQKLGYKNGMAESYLNLSVWCYRKDDYVKEKEYNEKAFALYQQTGNWKGIGNCYAYFSWTYYAMGNREKAMDNCLKATKIFDSLDYKAGLGRAYYFMGIINYEFSNNIPPAIRNMESAAAMQKAIGDKRELALTLDFLGSMYEKTGQADKALECYQRSLANSRESFNRNAESYALRSLGTFYETREDFIKAEDFFRQSLKLDEEAENFFGVIRNLNGLAKICLRKKDYNKALGYNEQCLSTAQKIGDKYGMMFVYDEMAKIYEAMNNTKNALKFSKLYIAMKDSVFNIEGSSKIAAMQTQSEYDKKMTIQQKENEKEKALADEKSKRQQLYIYFIVAVAIAVAAFAFFIFRSLRTTQKQKITIEKQKEMVEEKNKVIEQKNKDITDSINYAKRIQEAILPAREMSSKLFPDSFILFQPRDVVSGDFYWFEEKNGKKIIAAADCTGHGVPGAFMSMIGNAFLNEIVNEREITEPGKILSELRFLVIKALKQTGQEGEARDGMDISLLSFSSDSTVEFAGANNPLWVIRNGELQEYAPDKRPIGFFRGQGLPFANHKVDIRKGDSLYIFTDGYADQFGGPKGKKFKYRPMQETLLSIHNRPMAEQGEALSSTFDKWKGNFEQVDDVLFIGIRV